MRDRSAAFARPEKVRVSSNAQSMAYGGQSDLLNEKFIDVTF